MSDSGPKKYWLDDRRNVNKVVYGLFAVCALLVGLDLLRHDEHAHFEFENWFGFFGWFGFIACVGLVIAAKMMRKMLKRDEDYYDRAD